MLNRAKPPLCKDCEHFRHDDELNVEEFSKCYRNVKTTQSLLTGNDLIKRNGQELYCDIERKYNWLASRIGSQNCGRSGRYFKSRTDKLIVADETKETLYMEEYGKE